MEDELEYEFQSEEIPDTIDVEEKEENTVCNSPSYLDH